MTKSKITVIGFILFVLVIYTGSYFYTKNKNERLLSSPRLVMLIGEEETVNQNLRAMTREQRSETIRSFYQLGRVYSVSQENYDNGEADIAEKYKSEIGDENYVVVDCKEYGENLEKMMPRDVKDALKASWVFSACGIVE